MRRILVYPICMGAILGLQVQGMAEKHGFTAGRQKGLPLRRGKTHIGYYAGISFYPFTEPLVIPATIFFCINR